MLNKAELSNDHSFEKKINIVACVAIIDTVPVKIGTELLDFNEIFPVLETKKSMPQNC